MHIGTALESLLTFDVAICRQSWKNKRKALFINNHGNLAVLYETTVGTMAQTNYLLYTADIKATDWVMIQLDHKRGTKKLDQLQDILQKRSLTR